MSEGCKITKSPNHQITRVSVTNDIMIDKEKIAYHIREIIKALGSLLRHCVAITEKTPLLFLKNSPIAKLKTAENEKAMTFLLIFFPNNLSIGWTILCREFNLTRIKTPIPEQPN